MTTPQFVESFESMRKRPRLCGSDTVDDAWVKWQDHTPKQRANYNAWHKCNGEWSRFGKTQKERIAQLTKTVMEPRLSFEFVNRRSHRNLQFTCTDFCLREEIEVIVKRIREEEAEKDAKYSETWQRLKKEGEDSDEQQQLNRIADVFNIIRCVKDTFELMELMSENPNYPAYIPPNRPNPQELRSYLLTIPEDLARELPSLYFSENEMNPDVYAEWISLTQNNTIFPTQFWILTRYSIPPFRSDNINVVDLATNPLPNNVTTVISEYDRRHLQIYLKTLSETKLELFVC